MAKKKTPGVYLNEISQIPTSVAQVETAIPAFIGYTENIPTLETSLILKKTVNEKQKSFAITGNIISGIFTARNKHFFKLFDKNDPQTDLSQLITAFEASQKKVTINVSTLTNGQTLIIRYPVVEGVRISSMLEFKNHFGGAHYGKFEIPIVQDPQNNSLVSGVPVRSGKQSHILHYCVQLYFDNGGGPCYIFSVGNYQQAISLDAFNKGLNAVANVDELSLILAPDAAALANTSDYYNFCDNMLRQCGKLRDRFAILDVLPDDHDGQLFRNGIGRNHLEFGAAYTPFLNTSISEEFDPEKVILNGDFSNDLATDFPIAFSEKKLQSNFPKLYLEVKAKLGKVKMKLPPSPAIAGIYAQVDRNRGVWKAPANISVSSVIGPARIITNEDNENFNQGVNGEKSINVIRNFPGQGMLVWGARTLISNSNEWRYIPSKRFCIMVEESLKKSTTFAVFEPNDANTWLQLEGLINDYLNGLWRQGALAGPSIDQAFFVNVGLGKTMTALDIQQGRMIVEIGLALVRPAEFILIRISHKMHQP